MAYQISKIDRDVAEVNVNGLPYYFDDRTGLLSVWNISLLLDGAEEVVDRRGSFLDIPRLESRETSFVQIKQVMKINPAIYKYNFLDDVRLRIAKEQFEPGKTSYSTVVKIFEGNSSFPLVERYVKSTRIDNATRRPLEHPSWYLEKYSHLKGTGIPKDLLKTEIPKPPSNQFQYTSIVRHSDMDSNFHAKQSLYLKSCIDCATVESLRGRLVYFTGDIHWYPISYISIDFLGECFAGETIKIAMWEDTEDASLLRFAVFSDTTNKQLTYIVCKFEQKSKAKL